MVDTTLHVLRDCTPKIPKLVGQPNTCDRNRQTIKNARTRIGLSSESMFAFKHK